MIWQFYNQENESCIDRIDVLKEGVWIKSLVMYFPSHVCASIKNSFPRAQFFYSEDQSWCKATSFDPEEICSILMDVKEANTFAVNANQEITKILSQITQG